MTDAPPPGLLIVCLRKLIIEVEDILDKKLKKVLVCSSVISVVCIIFLYSISYVFPIPAIEIDDSMFSDEIELTEEANNDFAKFENIHKQFVLKLKERKIEYTSYIQNKHNVFWSSPEIYTFKIEGQAYLKFIDYLCLNEDKSFLYKKDFNAMKINGDRVVGFWDLPYPDKQRIFVYDESENLLTEYKSNGSKGLMLKLSPDPIFSFDMSYLNDYSEYLTVLEKDRILFISTKTSKYTTFKWQSKTKPSFFKCLPPNLNPGDSMSIMVFTRFIAYNGEDFFIFNAINRYFNKQFRIKAGLEQVVPNSPIYADKFGTHFYSIILDEEYPDNEVISINAIKILDFPIKKDPMLANINSNNTNQFFFGEQKTDYFELFMLDIYNRNLEYSKINSYNFVIPGTLSYCKKMDNTIFVFKTNKGLFALPEISQNGLFSFKNYDIVNLKDYSYKNIFGEDNFAIKNISHTIFDYHGRSYNLSTLIKAIFTGDRSYITYIVLFYLVLYAYLRLRAMSQNEKNDSSESE